MTSPSLFLLSFDERPSRLRDIRAAVGPAEEVLPDKLVEQHLASRYIYLPQPRSLRERQAQSGHLEVFTPNASDKRFVRRRVTSERLRRHDPALHERPLSLVKHLMNEGDSNRALADGGGHALEIALRAGLATFEDDRSPVAEAVRQEFIAHLGAIDANPIEGEARRFAHGDLHRQALQAARHTVLAMRTSDEIGDDAFHQMEEELDWIEMAGGGKEEQAEPKG